MILYYNIDMGKKPFVTPLIAISVLLFSCTSNSNSSFSNKDEIITGTDPIPYHYIHNYGEDFVEVLKSSQGDCFELVCESSNRYYVYGGKILNDSRTNYAIYYATFSNLSEQWFDNDCYYLIAYFENDELIKSGNVAYRDGDYRLSQNSINISNQFYEIMSHRYYIADSQYNNYDYFDNPNEIVLNSRQCTQYSFFHTDGCNHILSIDETYDILLQHEAVPESPGHGMQLSRIYIDLNDCNDKYYINVE